MTSLHGVRVVGLSLQLVHGHNYKLFYVILARRNNSFTHTRFFSERVVTVWNNLECNVLLILAVLNASKCLYYRMT